VDTPENTITAFQHAIDNGADWIEFDVQRTQDNVLVVIHDETVDRTTNGSGEISQMTLEQIQTLDAGNGEKVPTFVQVISLAKKNDVGIMPEAKSPDLYPGLAEQIHSTLENEEYVERSVLQSFDHDSLLAMGQKNPELAICPLHGLWQFDIANPGSSNAENVCPMAEMVLLYPWMIHQAHQDGKKVYVWFGVIESRLTMQIMRAMGADGIMVDNIMALVDILDR
jgi:glycerophosphoryl diester phosphodiesterase